MGKTLAYKILEGNCLDGTFEPGSEIAVRVNQTLTQDSTGTMVYLQLNAMDVEEIKTDLSVAYIDHNTLQSGFENADDHEFIRTTAGKYGIIFSKPGGGICHQVQLERFVKPGVVLIGSDSHTPTCGALGAIAIGAGGLDVAVGMAKGYYFITVPKVKGVHLTGKLRPGCNGKDVILKVLEKLTVKGGVGYIIEYFGEGLKDLSVTDRATICNMGAELGATTSIFPSDEVARAFMKRQNRAEDWKPLAADPDAEYDEVIDINLDELIPLAACPHSPDNIKSIRELSDIKVDQVAIGSCTNSSYTDMMKVAKILENRKVSPTVSLVISPGSSNILRQLSENGALATFIESGARILESACGPCIGMGQSPKSGAVSLRTFNRNFKGRSGTMDAQVYLVSPETAAASAITGHITDPTTMDVDFSVVEPENYGASDNYFILPVPKEERPEPVMGPNIKPFPVGKPLEDTIRQTIVLKTGDNVTTDDIVPSHAKLLPYRSNIPHLANFCFNTLVDDFKERTEKYGGGFVVGRDNYGQGSSREHAALVPLYLGIRAVIAVSFARIHKANLVNSGIIPLTFENPADYDMIDEYDELELINIRESIEKRLPIKLRNITKNIEISVCEDFSERQRDVILLGGYLNYSKNNTIGE
ncbi:MAG: aconitate hydratase [Eubacteriales bacterium]|nr:aconitate hydratase [Eubacteriales bacterium]